MTRPPPLLPTEVTLYRALSIARWASWLWTVGVAATGGDDLVHPVVAWLGVAASFGVAVAGTVGLRTVDRIPTWVGAAPFALLQAAVALGLVLADGVAFADGHVFATSQSLAAASPTIAAIAIGFALGVAPGVVGGALLGISRLPGALLNGVDEITGPRWGSITSSVVFLGLWGGVAGWLMSTLRTVETEVVTRRERDVVARTLHDTVLQALAVVARRSDDPELARLARRTDADVREFLYGPVATPHRSLSAAIHGAATRSARASDVELVVNVVDDEPPRSGPGVDALAVAVGEAVANSVKHGRAGHRTRIVVYAEGGADGLFASVRDDGPGFDPASRHDGPAHDGAQQVGQGIRSSIRGPVERLGGRIEIDSLAGSGTEVRAWIP